MALVVHSAQNEITSPMSYFLSFTLAYLWTVALLQTILHKQNFNFYDPTLTQRRNTLNKALLALVGLLFWSVSFFGIYHGDRFDMLAPWVSAVMYLWVVYAVLTIVYFVAKDGGPYWVERFVGVVIFVMTFLFMFYGTLTCLLSVSEVLYFIM